MRKGVIKNLIIIFAALCILVIFACVSISKFVLTDEKELVGVYTDFVLSHDGNGQTAVIRKNNSDDAIAYTGYITTTVSNFTDEKVSKRDVKFSLRAPTEEELEAGEVTDAWGVKHSIYQTSRNYDVNLVDENDNVINDTSDITLLKANVRNSSVMLLKINRKANADCEMPSEGTEQLSIILETTLPYKDLQVFTINTTMARLSVGVTSDKYNGYTREIVNLKSATEFVRDGKYYETASYLADVEFTLVGNVSFDTVRYEETYGKLPERVYDDTSGNYIIKLTIRPGADVNLYFYTYGSCTVFVSAKIHDKAEAEDETEEKVSGVGNDKIVFSIT